MRLKVGFWKILLVLTVLTSITAIYMLAKTLYYTRAELYVLRGVKETYDCKLNDCSEVEKYKENGWRVTRDKNIEHIINFSRYLPSGEVEFFALLDDSEENILTNNPSIETLEKVFEFLKADPEYQKHIWSRYRKHTNHIKGTISSDGYTQRDPFTFTSAYSVRGGQTINEHLYDPGCTQTYYVNFNLSGEILEHGISDEYCPGPY